MGKRLYKIEKLTHCVQVVFQSDMAIGPDDIIAAIDHENALYPIEDRQSLWDFRGCQITRDFGFDAMSRVVDLIRGTSGKATPTNKIALVVDDSTQYGLSRMFQMLMDGLPSQVSVFLDETAARNWIGLEVRSKEKGL